MELGSEFNLSLSDLQITNTNCFSYIEKCGMESMYVDSGRSAIKIVVEHLIPEGEILLPEFICESVIRCFSIDRVQFYRISDRFIIDVDDIKSKISKHTKAIFLMHYFGALQPGYVIDTIKKISRDYNLMIIEDVTHSLFSSPHTIGDLAVASIRKWMQIPHGGVLLSPKKLFVPFVSQGDNSKAYGMILKDMYLKDDYDCNAKYRSIFADSEEKLDCQENKYRMSDFTAFVMKCVDIDILIRRRKSNYNYLKEHLSLLGIEPAISMDDMSCPLAMPIRVPNRDQFRRYLIDNQIYCAVHWPSDGIREGERKTAVNNSQELISLPIDQRYTEEHMSYMVQIISRYGGELKF
mgnify:CR=1 FL=1